MTYVVPLIPVVRLTTTYKVKVWTETTKLKARWYLFGKKTPYKYQKMSWSEEKTKTAFKSNSSINLDMVDRFGCENHPIHHVFNFEWGERCDNDDELVSAIAFNTANSGTTYWYFDTFEERDAEWDRITKRVLTCHTHKTPSTKS